MEQSKAESAVLSALFIRKRELQAIEVSEQLEAAMRRKLEAESLIRVHIYTSHPIETYGLM